MSPCVVPLKTVTRKLIYTTNNRDLAKMTVIFLLFFGFYYSSHKSYNCGDMLTNKVVGFLSTFPNASHFRIVQVSSFGWALTGNPAAELSEYPGEGTVGRTPRTAFQTVERLRICRQSDYRKQQNTRQINKPLASDIRLEARGLLVHVISLLSVRNSR